ncbi:lysoplasmalogenase [Microlunatus elymi]|uniref:Lysoplasmalogenase n=1 Tax=Microlunatus elymi TaxID=2596828 RepID=A0A516PY34_9ACTN|nr:lysoplasmalogenase [Microlunatus elymi]QDP96080.1 lysoplasmalogenase [Microlunatus elymi]
MCILGSFGPPPPSLRPAYRFPTVMLAIGYLLCTVLDGVAEATGAETMSFVLRLLAMPLLIGVLITARPLLDRTVLLVLGALIFSWLGDTAGGVSFLIKIGLFLLAQLFFIAAFWPHRQRSLVTRPWAVIVYAMVLVGIGAPMIIQADRLAVPVMIYGFSLVAMAILATAFGKRAALGGLLFVISDSLLGLTWFYPSTAGHLMDMVIMLSYLSAQGLLVCGLLAHPAEQPDPARTGS